MAAVLRLVGPLARSGGRGPIATFSAERGAIEGQWGENQKDGIGGGGTARRLLHPLNTSDNTKVFVPPPTR